ncbi:MAG TPA: ABC transporter permease [Actinomycetota bacterium]|nr:ABC transporter permease [Actinomycetota bacterium]
MVTLDLRAGSEPAPASRRVVKQALFDTRNALRNGENLLLTLVIPIAVLVLGLRTPMGGGRSDAEALVGAAGLAVLATAFTSQAITTGFDRRYGVLRMLGLTPLGARGLLAARTLVSLLIISAQILVLVALTFALTGWVPTDPARILQAVLAILLAVWGFTAWALLIAGALRAEATLAVANAIFLVLMFAGGLAVPADSLPWSGFAQWLPTGALVAAMSRPAIAWLPLAILIGWGAVGSLLATRYFRWDS